MRVGVSVSLARAHTSAVMLAAENSEAESGQVQTCATVVSSEPVDAALDQVLAALQPPSSAGAVTSVTLATDWVSHMLRDGSQLAPTAALRLAQPGGSALPPLLGWSCHLRAAVAQRWTVLPGGHDPLGRLLAELDIAAVVDFARDAAAAGARAIAVTAAGSPAITTHEITAAAAIEQAVPELQVVLAHELGGLGLRARENTAILNAALGPAAATLVEACEQQLRHRHPKAGLLFVRHDGAVLNAESFRRLPITIADAHLAAELCGASALSGQENALVLGIGAHESEIGLVDAGWPRHHAQGTAMIAPGMAVSLPLPTHDTFPAGAVELGGSGSTTVVEQLCRAVTQLQESALARPVLAVGDFRGAPQLPALLDAQVPECAEAAAAVGAARAQPVAEISRVVVTDLSELPAEQERARTQALALVVRAGADPASAHIVAERVGPVGYLPSTVNRLWVRAEGVVEVQQ